jgi:hypothetical protein
MDTLHVFTPRDWVEKIRSAMSLAMLRQTWDEMRDAGVEPYDYINHFRALPYWEGQ